MVLRLTHAECVTMLFHCAAWLMATPSRISYSSFLLGDKPLLRKLLYINMNNLFEIDHKSCLYYVGGQSGLL